MAGIALRLILLYLAIDDAIGGERVINQYKMQEGANEEVREIKLATALLRLYNEKDVKEIESVVFTYIKITPFDPVNQRLYEQLKKNLEKFAPTNYFDNTTFT